jgi:DNA repair exonuclease SbcCD ATPase subunit
MKTAAHITGAHDDDHSGENGAEHLDAILERETDEIGEPEREPGRRRSYSEMPFEVSEDGDLLVDDPHAEGQMALREEIKDLRELSGADPKTVVDLEERADEMERQLNDVWRIFDEQQDRIEELREALDALGVVEEWDYFEGGGHGG